MNTTTYRLTCTHCGTVAEQPLELVARGARLVCPQCHRVTCPGMPDRIEAAVRLRQAQRGEPA